MTDTVGISGDRIRSFIERVEHLSHPLIFSRPKMQPEVGASLRRLSCDES